MVAWGLTMSTTRADNETNLQALQDEMSDVRRMIDEIDARSDDTRKCAIAQLRSLDQNARNLCSTHEHIIRPFQAAR